MRRKVFLWLAIGLVFLAPVRVFADAAATPDALCNQFMQAIQSHEWQKAYNCFSKTLQAKTEYQRWALNYEQYAPMFTIEHWKVDVQEKGERASGVITVTSKASDTESNADTLVELIRENGDWRISSYKPK